LWLEFRRVLFRSGDQDDAGRGLGADRPTPAPTPLRYWSPFRGGSSAERCWFHRNGDQWRKSKLITYFAFKVDRSTDAELRRPIELAVFPSATVVNIRLALDWLHCCSPGLPSSR
jgi:hypothetical protein